MAKKTIKTLFKFGKKKVYMAQNQDSILQMEKN
jgi:hypothetical protein